MSFRATGRPPATEDWTHDGGVFSVATDDTTRVLNQLTSWALAEGVQLIDLEVSRPSLEDIYLSLTGEAGV